ncbi:MAG: SDR family NAD(P)-dependent oxidoreductase, partial [Candidatus Lokiarchaeota archaeon]|nr:SDR family NAD(P)-dependent oxidoreductase [Candidatus Lokiarchaeota archaeon]
EMNFAVNHLAPFLLTNLLLDMLKMSAPSRIINVSSGAHKMAKIDFDDLQSENKKHRLFRVYGVSKLALMLFSYELSRKLDGTGVTVNTVHPGVVNTNLGRDMSKFGRRFGKLFFKNPEKGAETSIFLASSPEVEGITGKYYIKKQQQESSNESYNEDYAKRLWEISAILTKL